MNNAIISNVQEIPFLFDVLHLRLKPKTKGMLTETDIAILLSLHTYLKGMLKENSQYLSDLTPFLAF
jgi:hypothetical protein